MDKKYFDKKILAPTAPEALDDELKAACTKAYNEYVAYMDEYHLSDALASVFEMLSRANKYIDETTPWILAKSEETKPRLATVIYNLLEAIRVGAVLLSPFIPSTCEEIFRELNTEFVNYSDVEFGKLESGKSVGESKILFNRIDEKAMLEQIEAERKAKEEVEKPIEKPEGCAIITIDKFAEVELRTAQIIACEKVPKAKKLLKLQVDLGYEKRQVVSGIAKFYEPEELIGKKVVVVANLAPATLCGIESNGMLLASGEETVRVIFLDKDTPNGERVR
jgi:methionyl-tRNA synthetase